MSVAAYRSVRGSDSAPQSSASVTAAQRGSDAVAASLLSQAARRKRRFYTEQNSKAAYRSYLQVSCAAFFFFPFPSDADLAEAVRAGKTIEQPRLG